MCIEIDRHDIAVLIERKPHAGMDMLTALARQVHAAQELVRSRSMRNPNEVIEEESTFGERLADAVARFGGSWSFIIAFGLAIISYSAINVALKKAAWDPYPFILLNLFLSMLAVRPSARDHDEPESPGHQGSPARRTRLRCQPPRRIRDSRLVAQTESAG